MIKDINTLFRAVRMLILFAAALPELVHGQARPVTVDELAKRADVVVLGKVLALKSEWNNDKSRIFTRVTIGVDEVLKGDGSDRFLTITTPGGELDGVGELYSHTVRFANDEKVVVFAEKDKRGNLRVAGGERGKYTIKQSELTKNQMVADDVTLEAFTSRIRSAVKAQNEK